MQKSYVNMELACESYGTDDEMMKAKKTKGKKVGNFILNNRNDNANLEEK